MNLRIRGMKGWTCWHIGACLAMMAAGVAVTHRAWQDILDIGMNNEEASHILLVPIVAAWLVWVRRRRLRICRPGPSWVGPALIGVGWAAAWVGYNEAIQSFWHGGSVLVVVGCLLTIAGHDILMRFLPVFAVLIFLVPVPNMARQQIAIPLQTATAQVTEFLFDFVGADVKRNANVLTCNGVAVAIAEACNGMRMVFALLLVSYAFAFGTPLRNYVRFLILAASPVSAIACNVVRLMPTVWVYGYYPSSFAEQFHDISGWVMLPIAFLSLMAIIRILRWAMIPVTRYTLAYD